jgi:hypothetical protein
LAGVCGTIRIATRRRPFHKISQLNNSWNADFRSKQGRITHNSSNTQTLIHTKRLPAGSYLRPANEQTVQTNLMLAMRDQAMTHGSVGADAGSWCGPRREAGLVTRIVAAAASHPPGVGPLAPPAGADRPPGRPARRPPGGPATFGGQYGKNARAIASVDDYRRLAMVLVFGSASACRPAPENASPAH